MSFVMESSFPPRIWFPSSLEETKLYLAWLTLCPSTFKEFDTLLDTEISLIISLEPNYIVLQFQLSVA